MAFGHTNHPNSVVVGVDTGGTFTDVFLRRSDHPPVVVKVPSDREDPGRAVVCGLIEAAAKAGIEPTEILRVAHGTTVATNALIEGVPTTTALITTTGFRDVLEIGTTKRPPAAQYDVAWVRPEVLIDRSARFEVDERIDHEGVVARPLREDDLDRVVDQVAASGAASVAVCLLFGYLNPVHEQQVGARLRERLPELKVMLSHEILPELREYERVSAVAVAASLAPSVATYLASLAAEVTALGAGDLFVMQSNGGLGNADAGVTNPARLVMSGPAAGVQAVQSAGSALGLGDLISIDMGGTSFDVGLLRDGRPGMTSNQFVAGVPLRLPMLDMLTIGAGGGSLAWIDAAGGLRVGPRSSGAVPGPACYGRGGAEPTVTDAAAVLGILNPEGFNAGKMTLDVDAARAAMAPLADHLGGSAEDAAADVLRIVNATMADAIRLTSVSRGHDPREFTLVSIGGAVPMHAAMVADELDVPWLLVPEHPGVLSAVGLSEADVVWEYSRTWAADSAVARAEDAAATYHEMVNHAARDAAEGRVDASGITIERSIDIAYRGQGSPLRIEVPGNHPFDDTALERAIAEFHEAHQMTFGVSNPGNAVKFHTLRVRASAPAGAASASEQMPETPVRVTLLALVAERVVGIGKDNAMVPAAIYRRDALQAGDVVRGPAVIEAEDTTIVVPEARVATVTANASIMIGAQAWTN